MHFAIRAVSVGFVAATLGACQGSADPVSETVSGSGESPDAGTSSNGQPKNGQGSGATTPSASGKQSLIWVWNDYANSLATVTAHASSFTHVSPALYQLNYAYTSGVAQWWNQSSDNFEGMSSTQMVEKVHAAGMKVVPLVFAGGGNGGTDQGIHNIITDSPAGARESFITSMVNEAIAKGYDGYNLDWEFDNTQTTYAGYGAALDSFLASFRNALHAHGMQLSFDLGSWYLKQSYCSGGTGVVDLATIGANVDLAIIENYANTLGTPSASCPASVVEPQTCTGDFTSILDLMCVHVPNAVISMGFNAKSVSGSNPIAGAALAATRAYGIRNIAVWPDSNNDGPGGSYVTLDANGIQPQTTWFQLLSDFLAAP